MNAKLRYRILCMLLTTLLVGAVALKASAGDEPAAVDLDDLAQWFEGVAFDHQLHVDLGEDCAVCHHHTTGTGTTDPRCTSCHADSPASASVACRDCHLAEPFSAAQIHRQAADVYQYHVDKPGLKAAYHWSCLGCHQAMDGPTGCQDCHARTPAGDAFYHADAETQGQASH